MNENETKVLNEKQILAKRYGPWGDMRKDFLVKWRPKLWRMYLKEGTLDNYLEDIEERYSQRAIVLEEQIRKADGLTEEMKMKDPEKWAALMNTTYAQIREIFRAELMYLPQEEWT